MAKTPDQLPFSPYEKIAANLADWLGDDEAAFRAAHKTEWIVTEKIHGANFCFVTDGSQIHCAKRKGFLPEGEDFFGHKVVLKRLERSILALFALLKSRDTRVELVSIYGELYGGKYPHPDVPPVPGVSHVQTGVWYSPRIEFCAFDVGVQKEGLPGRIYLEQEEARKACMEAKIPFVRPLFRGSYEDAFAYPIGFETTLPALLGLPSLGPTNKAEGVVLKPARALLIPRREALIRPVVKRKIDSFAEDARFHQAKKWATPAPSQKEPEVLETLKQEISSLVNENRLNAAISKVGPTSANDPERMAQVLSLIREDLHEELVAKHKAKLQTLSPSETIVLGHHLNTEVNALVELYIGPIPEE